MFKDTTTIEMIYLKKKIKKKLPGSYIGKQFCLKRLNLVLSKVVEVIVGAKIQTTESEMTTVRN